jgi:hypothetical protein
MVTYRKVTALVTIGAGAKALPQGPRDHLETFNNNGV